MFLQFVKENQLNTTLLLSEFTTRMAAEHSYARVTGYYESMLSSLLEELPAYRRVEILEPVYNELRQLRETQNG